MSNLEPTPPTVFERRLEALRDDFIAVSGEPFRDFFCPIVMKDDHTDLCKAHLVNQAFPSASRRWTVQRADVDNFFGAFFESDFVDLKSADSPFESVIKDNFSRSLKPNIFYRGEKVQYYIPRSTVPPAHSHIELSSSAGSIRLALKIEPSAMPATTDDDWQIDIQKDCRLAALVSVLKAAHLTLFDMLGYRYALSAGGLFLGHTILGKFFLENQGLPKKTILENARKHFAEFSNLVRPILSPNEGFEDTVSNRALYICEASTRWAFLIFIRTGSLVHTALVPSMETPDAAARFVEFLKERGSKFQARRCVYDGEIFKASRETEAFTWPEASLD